MTLPVRPPLRPMLARLARELPSDGDGRYLSEPKWDAKVLLDWLQNDSFRSTVAPYSLRATPEPTVSMPVGWDDVERGAAGETSRLLPGPAEALDRLDREGDVFADVLTVRQRLPGSDRRPDGGHP